MCVRTICSVFPTKVNVLRASCIEKRSKELEVDKITEFLDKETHVIKLEFLRLMGIIRHNIEKRVNSVNFSLGKKQLSVSTQYIDIVAGLKKAQALGRENLADGINAAKELFSSYPEFGKHKEATEKLEKAYTTIKDIKTFLIGGEISKAEELLQSLQ